MSRRGITAAERIKRLLVEADVGARAAGGAALLAEPVIVLRGEHTRGFKLFDHAGIRIGSAIAVVVPISRLRRHTHIELRDVHGGCVLTVRDGGPFLSRLLMGWNYQVLEPDGSASLTVRRVARRTERASIMDGDAQLGVIRPGNPSFLSRALKRTEYEEWPTFVVEAVAGHHVARVRLARPSWRTKLIHLVVELEDGASEQLRKAALAASVKAAFIAAIVQAKRSRRGSHGGRGGGYGLAGAADLAGSDIDF
jgi:hypothetical protein